jgi:AraC-like DNA-binding protein
MRVAGSAAWIPTVSNLDIPGLSRWRTGGPTSAEPTGHLKNHAYGDPAAVGRLEIAEVAWLQVARIIAGRHRLVHNPSATAIPSAAIALQVTGTSVIEQYGRTARLIAGNWNVCNSCEPYTLMSPVASQRLVLLVPNNRIERGIDLRTVAARAFSGTSGISRLAFGAANWLIEEFASLGMVRAEDLAGSLSRLMNLAIYERTRQQPAEPGQRPLAERIREYIAQHLHDPDLSLDTIARDLNASKRSLHRGVSDIDGSIHNLIWHARLERCREDLRDPTKSQQSIAAIAQSWGFKNSTHFSRAFRTRFGMSAREARREALAGSYNKA